MHGYELVWKICDKSVLQLLWAFLLQIQWIAFKLWFHKHNPTIDSRMFLIVRWNNVYPTVFLEQVGTVVGGSGRCGSTCFWASGSCHLKNCSIAPTLLTFFIICFPQDGINPLMRASCCGHKTTVELLLCHGADVNTVNRVNSLSCLMQSQLPFRKNWTM